MKGLDRGETGQSTYPKTPNQPMPKHTTKKPLKTQSQNQQPLPLPKKPQTSKKKRKEKRQNMPS